MAWAEALDQHQIWWAPVNSLEEVLASEQARQIGAFIDLPAGKADDKPMKSVASPVDFDRTPTQAGGPCPRLGEHTDEVIQALNRGQGT